MEKFLTFRMDRVERDIDRLERLMEQAISRDSESRNELHKAMYELTIRQDDTSKKLSEVIDLMKPVIDDFRQRSYGQTYVSKYFSASRYMAALALAAIILMALPFLPALATYLARTAGGG
jgi:leucyl-tRNA synthetase